MIIFELCRSNTSFQLSSLLPILKPKLGTEDDSMLFDHRFCILARLIEPIFEAIVALQSRALIQSSRTFYTPLATQRFMSSELREHHHHHHHPHRLRPGSLSLEVRMRWAVQFLCLLEHFLYQQPSSFQQLIFVD